jgi:hypothetical protein
MSSDRSIAIAGPLKVDLRTDQNHSLTPERRSSILCSSWGDAPLQLEATHERAV